MEPPCGAVSTPGDDHIYPGVVGASSTYYGEKTSIPGMGPYILYRI